jgi:hypothetical protein
MPFSADGYERRARECVRLAHLATDDMVQGKLLALRQVFLATAERLRSLSSDEGKPDVETRPLRERGG